MTKRTLNSRLLGVLLLSLVSMLAGHTPAQTFMTLYTFTPPIHSPGPYPTNSDGQGPNGILILSGSTLYGTTGYGGVNGRGTLFAIETDGTGFTTSHVFSNGTNPPDFFGNLINSDGAQPSGGLLLSDNTLYGTTSVGGTNGNGTLFALNTDGTGFRTLESFAGLSDGGFPNADLVLSGSTLYGTCHVGGTDDSGTVFAVNIDGTGFKVLYRFSPFLPDFTNSDGGGPSSGLALSGNTLYGAAEFGGSSGNGTVFAINIDGTGFTTLHSFTGGTDGARPIGRLLLLGKTLYGTAQEGGRSGNGTVFAVNTNGTSFTTLHAFTARSGDSVPSGTNTDGVYPVGGLILLGNTLYGTAMSGGSFGGGTVFSINADGTAFTTIYNFTTKADGEGPIAGLILSGSSVYGTTFRGGSITPSGTVFSLSLPAQLTITPSGQNLTLSWPTNFAGCTLQSTTNFNSPDWASNLPAPVVLNGQYMVTNSTSDTQQFFRLVR